VPSTSSRSRRRFIHRPRLVGQAARYAVTGATVAGFYVGGTLALSHLGMPMAAAIAIAYTCAVSLHFALQRTFVFRGAQFGLSVREQALRYLVIGVVQYSVTAGATESLPDLVGVSPEVAYLLATVTFSAAGFLVLRSQVFHEHR
jgi:putative flippase GtrA